MNMDGRAEKTSESRILITPGGVARTFIHTKGNRKIRGN